MNQSTCRAAHAVGKCVVRGRAVLELGCGPGAVGLVAAALGAHSVALTDLPHVLVHTAENVQVGICVEAVLAADQSNVQRIADSWVSKLVIRRHYG